MPKPRTPTDALPDIDLDLVKASDLLYERLLTAYSSAAEEVQEVEVGAHFIIEQPGDSAALIRLLRAQATQLLDARHLLEGLAKRLDILSGPPLLRPDKFRKLWQSIIETWNRAYVMYDWWALQPLCQSCGSPVPLRDGPRRKGERVKQSLYCSERCRRANTERVGKQRRKQR